LIQEELGAEVTMEKGHYGQLSIEVDGREVVDAGALAFLGVLPSLRKIREAVEAQLKKSGGDRGHR
jgi:hypothetical protein